VKGYDTAFGRYAFAASLGQTIGPGSIALFAGPGHLPGTDNAFLGAAGVSVLLLLITCPMRCRRRAPARRRERRSDMGALLRSPSVLRAIIAGSVVLSATDVVLVYLPALGTERGIDPDVIAVLLVVRGAASMATRFSMGWMAGVLGRQRLMTASIGMAALATAFVAVPMPPVLLGITVALAGFGLGVGQPLSMSWLAEVAPQGARGMAMSLRLTGNRLGQVVVPSLVGLVAARAGVSAVLCLTAAVLGSAGMTVRGLEDPPEPGSGGQP
jgi:predicted MFS family arabinose efflux permease